MVRQYVHDWYKVALFYFNICADIEVRFKDGKTMNLNSTTIPLFSEEIYSRYLKDNGFRYEESGGEPILITPDGLKIIIIRPAHSFVIDEIFLMKVYKTPQSKDSVVIDVGAGIGDGCLYFAKYASRVYGYEVNGHLSQIAQKNIAQNNLNSRVFIFNEPASAQKLQNLMTQENLTNVYLKIDCEGCEYEIVKNLDFARVNQISMEYHQDPKPLMTKLRDSGFETQLDKEMIYAIRKYTISS